MSEAMRIVLVGKTGVGKSASGNTILGKDAFHSDISSVSVTAECKKEKGNVHGREVHLIDTPGLFDTGHSNEEIAREIVKCVTLSSPGPHVFLVVIHLGIRFTQKEQTTVRLIKSIFGEESAKYTMALFTHGESLKKITIKEFISQSKQLEEFTAQCHGGHHVFNNEDKDNHCQVTELLQKIEKMVALNGGGYYTNEMYQKVEEVIEKKKQEILKEEEQETMRKVKELEQKIEDKEELAKAKEELKKREEEAARVRAELDSRLFV